MLSIYSIVKYGIIIVSCKMYACCMDLLYLNTINAKRISSTPDSN